MPPSLPASGITLAAEPARDRAPDDADAGARVEPAREHGRQLGDELGQREGEVLGQVRAAGVAAAAGEPDLEASAAPVSGPSRSPTRPTSMVGSQCRQKMRLDAVERAERPSAAGAAGHDLLGGLEQQPHAPGQQPAACTSASARPAPSRAGGVDVVTAGVGDARRPGCATGRSVSVVDRQRVEVGAQRHQPAAVAEVGDQARVAGARSRRQPTCVEAVATRSVVRRPRPGQLGVGVQVAAQVDEVVGVLVDHRLDDGERCCVDMSGRG